MGKTKIDYVVGIDNGTQACTTMLLDLDGNVLGIGEYKVPMIAGKKGEREHNPVRWKTALTYSMKEAQQVSKDKGDNLGRCLAVCPSGQMHGESIILSSGRVHNRVRLWCDSRNSIEAKTLTGLFNLTIPQRLTISRWLWTIINRPDLAKQCIGLTTPAGVLAKLLGGAAWGLGLGEARGMFPIDQGTLQYDATMAERFDEYVADLGAKGINPILNILPPPVMVGETTGYVDTSGHKLTGLPIGTPIVSPEGDQPMTLAGTYVYEEGSFAFSGGTSICANLITTKAYYGFHPGVEPFMTADGKLFMMCHVQNGTSFMNLVVKLFGELFMNDPFTKLMPLADKAPVDCGGIIILPLAEPEHGLDLPDKAHSAVFNLNSTNNTPGNIIRAAFMGSMFSIRYSVEAMKKQSITAKKIVASGGIVKSPWIAQAIADIFNLPVHILGEAVEGSAYGAGLVALYSARKQLGAIDLSWDRFLAQMKPQNEQVFQPNPEAVKTCDKMFLNFCQILSVEKTLNEISF